MKFDSFVKREDPAILLFRDAMACLTCVKGVSA